MIAGGLTPQYRSAYERPHEATIRVEVWDDVQQLDEISITGGSVDCSLGSQVTRSGSITVDSALMPRKPTDLLAPFGNRLRIYRGIRISDGLDLEFRVFTGLIMKAERRARGLPTITFADRAAEVAENDFEAAEETRAGANIVDEILRIIREGVPRAEFGQSDAIAMNAAAQVFDDSRSQACDTLADAGGAFWYALADGRFVVRRVPWTYHPNQAVGLESSPVPGVQPIEPVVAYYSTAIGTDAAESSGSILDYGEVLSRERLYNIVIGEGDQPNSQEPIRAVVRDTNATSPTYVYGKFGRRVMSAELPAAATEGGVRHGASTLLRRARASAEALPLLMVPDCALELGDLVALHLPGRVRPVARVIAEFTIPLTPEGSMTASTRPLVLPDGTVIDEL